MAWYRCGGGGLPAGLQSDMDAVLNKKFGTSTTYLPTDWAPTVNLMGPLPERTASGAIAHFEDGADGVPVKNWLVTLPASLDGYTEVNAVRSGKNLISTIQQGGIDGTNGTETASNTHVRTGFIKVNSSTKYTCAVNSSNTNMVVFQVVEYSSASVSGFISATGKNAISTTFTTSATTKYIRVTARDTTSANITPTDLSNWQLEQGETATTFEAFNGTQYTASLGRTIYGGTADIVTGEGEVSYKNFTLDNFTWSGGVIGGQTWCWYVDLSAEGLKLPANSAIFDGICDNYSPIRYNGISSNANTIALRSNGYLYVNNGSDTVEPTGNVTIALNTPTPFTFTSIAPTPETALGVNNFWADEGDSDVTYRADIDLLLGGQ